MKLTYSFQWSAFWLHQLGWGGAWWQQRFGRLHRHRQVCSNPNTPEIVRTSSTLLKDQTAIVIFSWILSNVCAVHRTGKTSFLTFFFKVERGKNPTHFFPLNTVNYRFKLKHISSHIEVIWMNEFITNSLLIQPISAQRTTSGWTWTAQTHSTVQSPTLQSVRGSLHKNPPNKVGKKEEQQGARDHMAHFIVDL